MIARYFLIFASPMMMLGCAPRFVQVEKPSIPVTESDCKTRGGNWTTLGLSYPGKPKICDLKASDAGKVCTDSKHCQGICLAPDDARIGVKAVGQCSPYLSNFGNVVHVENGRAEQMNVE
jgi:hypothetical protein